MATIKAIEDAARDISEAGKEDLEKQIARLQADIATLTRNLSSIGAGKARTLSESGNRIASDAADVSQGVLDAIRAEADALESRLSAQVREKPLQTIGIAAGIGFVLALLARR